MHLYLCHRPALGGNYVVLHVLHVISMSYLLLHENRKGFPLGLLKMREQFQDPDIHLQHSALGDLAKMLLIPSIFGQELLP